MLKWFNRRRRLRRTAHNLYGSIVTASRQHELFAAYGVPDTAEGRFELLLAYLFLVLERLRREGESAAPLAQSLVDAFFADLDTSMRELGVGDMAVPKKMRNLAGVMKERMNAYRAAMDADDERLLAGLVGETMSLRHDGPMNASMSFAAYMRDCLNVLQRQPVEMLHTVIPAVPAMTDSKMSTRRQP